MKGCFTKQIDLLRKQKFLEELQEKSSWDILKAICFKELQKQISL